jgi:hypothetical protein
MCRCLCSLLFAAVVDHGFVGVLELGFAAEFRLQFHHVRTCLCNLWFVVCLGLGFVACRGPEF